MSTERSSLDATQKILAERDKQLEILNKELSISRLQLAEIKEEARKVREHSRIVEERQAMELDSMRQALDKSFANQESLRDELITKVDSSHSEGDNSSQVDSVDTSSMTIGIQTSSSIDVSKIEEDSLKQGTEALKSQLETVERLNDTLRTLGGLQSCLSSLKNEMEQLNKQISENAGKLAASTKSSKFIESQIEDLRRSSTLTSPAVFVTSTPASHSSSAND